EFFAPETLMVPRRGLPPRMTNLSIWLVYGWRMWMRVPREVRAAGTSFIRKRPAECAMRSSFGYRDLHTGAGDCAMIPFVVPRHCCYPACSQEYAWAEAGKYR